MKVCVLVLCAFVAVANAVTDDELKAASQDYIKNTYKDGNYVIVDFDYTTATVITFTWFYFSNHIYGHCHVKQ